MKTTVIPAILLILMTCIPTFSFSETLAIIRIESGQHARYHMPVWVFLDSLTTLSPSEIVLYELRDGERYPVAIQFSKEAEKIRMHWQTGRYVSPHTTLTYELVEGMPPGMISFMHINNVEGNFVMQKGHQPILKYHATLMYPPEGEDEALKRDGFIHPLYAPDGTVLTAIQPPDHMHHYGIWNPWTHTTFSGEEVDFWNLRKKQGTVRHAGVQHITEGPVYANIQSLHQHIAWPQSSRETIAIHEMHTIKVINTSENIFQIDFEFTLMPVESLVLEEYRYGGFVFRGSEQWNRHNTTFFTSEGLDRDQADGERAQWCVVTGDSKTGGKAGILFMGHPQNFNHPEPLRVWPSDANNGNGDVFINFSPTRNTSWNLEKDQSYILRYRLIVFTGDMNMNLANNYWNDYIHPPVISWEIK